MTAAVGLSIVCHIGMVAPYECANLVRGGPGHVGRRSQSAPPRVSPVLDGQGDGVEGGVKGASAAVERVKVLVWRFAAAHRGSSGSNGRVCILEV